MEDIKDSDRKRLSRRMETLKRQTMDEIYAAGEDQSNAATVTSEPIDNVERAEIARLRDIGLAESAIDRARLAEIGRAQDRMAEGSYGRCINCQRTIPRARLLAKPEALRCVECQTIIDDSLRR